MHNLRKAVAITAIVATLPVMAADGGSLSDRLEQLEKEVETLRLENNRINTALESERISENDPELVIRLKGAEMDAAQGKEASGLVELFDGIAVEAVLTTITQNANGLPDHTEGDHSQLNYRADVAVELPFDTVGDISQKVFAHWRAGQGDGLNNAFGNAGILAGTPNAVAFRASGSPADDSVLVLAQAWYQAILPLPRGGFLPHSRHSLEITFGKVDIYGFFDQNEVANDESIQFINTVFVNNPLLDAGGEAATDANGFQPGIITSFNSEVDPAEPWRLSIGVLGAGSSGSNYEDSNESPLVMVQLEKEWKLFGGLSGNYRLYGWTRNNADNVDDTVERHTGAGISLDQRLGDGIRIFARYGQMMDGYLAFDRSVTLGGELSGNYWDRAGDTLGMAVGNLHTDWHYRKAGGSIDADADGVVDYTFVPVEGERVAEIYYRYHISPQVELTPDIQWIGQPGGDKEAKDVTVISLRANFVY